MRANLCCFGVLCATAPALAGPGPSWNAANGFSTASNPAMPWEWFEATSGPPTVGSATLLSAPWNISPALHGWRGAGGGGVYKNTSGASALSPWGAAVAPGQLVLDGVDNLDGDSRYVAAAWFAPANGAYHISVTFIAADTSGTFTDVLVGQFSTVYSAGTVTGYGNAGPSGIGSNFGAPTFSWSGDVTLAGSQAVLFMARMSGARGAVVQSDVILDATITQVPVPGGLALLAVAGALAGRRRR
jgi:hypothetical protein